MSETRECQIHHMDDQLGYISKLRENMAQFVQLRKPGWVPGGQGSFLHLNPKIPLVITICRPGSAPLTIRYLIYDSENNFLSGAIVRPGDVVLLDAFQLNGKGRQELLGGDCAEKAAKAGVPPERVLLISAYLREIPDNLKLLFARDGLIQKPIDYNQLSKRLLLLAGLPDIDK